MLGFDPVQFLTVGAFNLLYQFWIHTEHIGKIGWLEYIINTPSHHRVHHGRDPKYIDKNYAGVFIVWDRMFGTFKEEEERPTYGITKSLNSWNPLYANFAHYIDLYNYVKQSKSWSDTKNMLFKQPGWLPNYLGGAQTPGIPTSDFHKYNADVSFLWAKLYIFVQFIGLMVVTALFLFTYKDYAYSIIIGSLFWIIWSTIMLGMLFESRTNFLITSEILRLIFLPFGVWGLIQSDFNIQLWSMIISTSFSLLSLSSIFFIYRNNRD